MALPTDLKQLPRAERKKRYVQEKRHKMMSRDYLCCQSPSHRCGGGAVHLRQPKGTPRRHYPDLRAMVLAVLPLYESRELVLTKEAVAARLGAFEHEVEQVFRQLNQEGILSQPSHECTAHDTRRNRFFPANRSGWSGDTYALRVEKD